jgi:glycosyltransferase involved in cell wall biosynthesis
LLLRILVLTKRQYTGRDIVDDRFGRLRELPLELALKGHTVHGLCLSYVHKKEGFFLDGPVCWHSINATPLKFPGLIRFLREARAYALESDVIWAGSDSIYGIIGYGLSKIFKIPLVFDLYDNFDFFLMARLPIIKQLYRHVVKKCDIVTCVSGPLANLVNSYGRKKRTTILENAVRKDLFLPLNKENCRDNLKLPQNVRIIGTAGALQSNRGIKILFDAFNIIKNKYPDLHLAVAGPRDIKIPRNTRIHDLGVLPFDSVPIFLNALDISIVCNLDNAFGNYCFPQKTREIMSCNIPIVAANVGSMKELFKDRPEWLYEPGNVQSLIRVLENRIHDRTTHYAPLPSWSDLAQILEKILIQIQNED